VEIATGIARDFHDASQKRLGGLAAAQTPRDPSTARLPGSAKSHSAQDDMSHPMTPGISRAFALVRRRWDNMRMHRLSFTRSLLLALLALGSAFAQQATPPPKTAAPKSATAPKTTTQHSPAAKPAVPLALKTPEEKFSYALGMNLGTTLKRQSLEVDPAILAQGLKDMMSGGKTLLTEEEERSSLMDVQNQLRKKEQDKMQALGEQNKKDGEAFLAANKSKEGIVTLPSGLQYKILTQGTGPKPTTEDTVVCNYRGTLIDGKEFDSSYQRGKPATFPVGRVIHGWTEALPLMPTGSKWQLFIPSDLAYGERGAGPNIGPNATLIFEVELLSIQPKTENKPQPDAAGSPK